MCGQDSFYLEAPVCLKLIPQIFYLLNFFVCTYVLLRIEPCITKLQIAVGILRLHTRTDNHNRMYK